VRNLELSGLKTLVCLISFFTAMVSFWWYRSFSCIVDQHRLLNSVLCVCVCVCVFVCVCLFMLVISHSWRESTNVLYLHQEFSCTYMVQTD
jgi:uncharacterized membrane protein YidH (DUF202 family)